MVETFSFAITQSPQIFVKKDFNCLVRIKAEQGIYVGDENVTIQNGFPLTDGYHNFKLQANDFLYVIGSYTLSHMRVIIVSDTP